MAMTLQEVVIEMEMLKENLSKKDKEIDEIKEELKKYKKESEDVQESRGVETKKVQDSLLKELKKVTRRSESETH